MIDIFAFIRQAVGLPPREPGDPLMVGMTRQRSYQRTVGPRRPAGTKIRRAMAAKVFGIRGRR